MATDKGRNFFSRFSKNCVGRHSGYLHKIYRYALVIQGNVVCFSKKKSGLPTCVIYQCKYSKRFYHNKITSPNQCIYKQIKFFHHCVIREVLLLYCWSKLLDENSVNTEGNILTVLKILKIKRLKT